MYRLSYHHRCRCHFLLCFLLARPLVFKPGPGTGSFSYMPRSIFPTQTFVKGRGIRVITLVAANQTGGKAIRSVRATKDSIRLAFPPTTCLFDLSANMMFWLIVRASLCTLCVQTSVSSSSVGPTKIQRISEYSSAGTLLRVLETGMKPCDFSALEKSSIA